MEKKYSRIILIGEGHGFESLVNGIAKSGFTSDFFSRDKQSASHARRLGLRELTEDEFFEFSKSEQTLVISSGYRSLISSEQLSYGKFLNIHYADFPKYRGMHSIVWAILNGEKKIAVSLHEMTEDFDAGPIVWKKKLSVKKQNSWDLMLRCDSIVEREIGKVITKYLDGKLTPKNQDERKATYVGKRNPNDCKVRWNEWDGALFSRHLQALVSPYPRPHFYFNDKKFEIVSARVVNRKYFEIPGHVVYVTAQAVYVKLPDSLLEIRTLFTEGEGELPANTVFRRPGARLS